MSTIKISVAYGKASTQCWLRLQVPEGSTVGEAIELSGILQRYPEIDLASQKVGLFGKPTKLNTPLEPGQRVEIYQPITVDPDALEYRE